MRGKLLLDKNDVPIHGITPARAGKTSGSKASLSRYSDHPRVCRENHRSVHSPALHLGSPLRVRGTRIVVDALKRGLRITPRVCGENPKATVTEDYDRGSPPLMRGKLQSSFRRAQSWRITPAYAGKTLYYITLKSNGATEDVDMI